MPYFPGFAYLKKKFYKGNFNFKDYDWTTNQTQFSLQCVRTYMYICTKYDFEMQNDLKI